MRSMANAYSTYQNSRVLTASPAELTLMLYDGIIKFINIAKSSLERKDYETMNKNVQKAIRIVDHLTGTLNEAYPVAQDFKNIYGSINQALINGNIHKDVTELDRALSYAQETRNTWAQVMKKSTEKQPFAAGAGA